MLASTASAAYGLHLLLAPAHAHSVWSMPVRRGLGPPACPPARPPAVPGVRQPAPRGPTGSRQLHESAHESAARSVPSSPSGTVPLQESTYIEHYTR